MEQVKQLAQGSKWKKDFPILARQINGSDLVYLDSAATSQKPFQVIRAVKEFYENDYTNVHRGMNTLSERATDKYEGARERIAKFINAAPEEIIFVRNATEGLNLIAHSFVKPLLSPGSTILLTEMEHHSNLVPWQLVAGEKKSKLEFIPVNEIGELSFETLTEQLKIKPVAFSFTHVSNLLGTINPVKEMVKLAQDQGVPVVLDAAQSAPHLPLDVKDLGVDFAVLSGHKMLGPSGIGVVYGKREHLEKMPPFLAGGDMIKEVSLESATWNDLPWKFEAGTPNIAGVIGLSAAVGYLQDIGMDEVHSYTSTLTKYAFEKLSSLPFVKLYGPRAEKRSGLVSFNVGDAHPHDVSSILDAEGIEIRSGHMCAQPMVRKLGVESVSRASFHIYNSLSDVDKLVQGMEKVAKVFKL